MKEPYISAVSLQLGGAAMGLRVANITKRFRDVTAVNGLSFAVERAAFWAPRAQWCR